MDLGWVKNWGCFLLLAVIVFHKCQPWDQDSCMSDLLVLCVRVGVGGGERMGSKGNRKRKEEKPGHGVTRQNSSLRLILRRVCSDSCVSQSLAKNILGSGWGS